MPHLRRFVADCVQIVTFQFSQDGGQFTIEVGSCGAEGVHHRSGKHVPADKVTTRDLPGTPRLGGEHPDHWLVFGPRVWKPGAPESEPTAHYDGIAQQAVTLVIREGLPYLDSACAKRSTETAPRSGA